MLFMDELHTLVGAGAAEGAIDASNMLKPALARGELQCIGATTLNEYRKYIEKDGALERRFQMIMVDEPTVDETIQIIKGLRDRYEAHHRVSITDDAIVAAAQLSHRYISGRFLPDKAIDLIDEAGSRTRLRITTMPPEIRTLEKEVEKSQTGKGRSHQDPGIRARRRPAGQDEEDAPEAPGRKGKVGKHEVQGGGGGDLGGHRLRGLQVDRHSHDQAGREGKREASAHGGRTPQAHRGPG